MGTTTKRIMTTGRVAQAQGDFYFIFVDFVSSTPKNLSQQQMKNPTLVSQKSQLTKD
jgi:hypothetical protein